MAKRIVWVVAAGVLLGWRPMAAAMSPHPRIWLTPARLTAIQGRLGANSPEWQAFNGVVSQSLTACVSGTLRDVQSALLMDSYALAYQVLQTSNPALAAKYAKCASNLMKWTLSNYTAATLHPDSFTGDGATTAFTLSNVIYGWCDSNPGCSIGHPHSVTVSGVAKTVGQQGVDSGKDVYWTYGSAALTFASPPAAGAAILVVHNRPFSDSGACPYGSGTSDFCPPLQSLDDFRNLGQKLAVVFDWIYPTLTPTDKTYFAGTMIAAAQPRLTSQLFYSFVHGAGALNNECSGGISRLGLIGLATYGDNPTDGADTNALILGFDKFFDGVVTPGSPELVPQDDVLYAFTHGTGRGGAITEGPEYGPQDLEYYTEVFDAFLSANGTDYYARIPNFAADVVNYTLTATSPTLYPVLGGGQSYFPLPSEDEQQGSQLELTEFFRIYMLHVADYLGASTSGNYARFWLNNLQPIFKPGLSCGGWCMFDLLFSNVASAATTDYRQALSADYAALGAGRVTSRSDWTQNATWVGFFAGPQRQDHNHAEANSFFFLRKGAVLSMEEIGWGPQYVPGELHNTLSLNGSATSPWNGYPSVVYKEDGDAAIVQYESDPGNRYMYAVGDASQAYRSQAYTSPQQDFANVQQFTREFVFLKPDIVVTYDRVGYQNHHALSRAYFQFGGHPAVSSNVITYTAGGQKLGVTSLLPASAQIDVTQNCQLGWIGANVHQTTCGPSVSNCYQTACAGGGSFTTWSASVTSPALSLSEQFLTVVQGMDATNSPLPAETISGAGIVAAHIKDPSQDKIVAFSANPSGAASAFPLSYSFNAVATDVVQMIADLPPNTAVHAQVTRSGSAVTVSVSNTANAPGQAATTTANGILFIGGSVTGPPPPPASCDLNSDGVVNVLDVQAVVNQALGVTPCTTGDLIGNGHCNVIDVQRVISAALGLPCKTGP